jgi:iron complex transport system ATP-binding protein
MLTLDQISFGYNGRPVLADISLDIQSGQMAALLGPNGAGKSTLLRLMNRTLKPQRGRVCLNGQDLRQLSARQIARQIALVEQASRLVWPYTVIQTLKLGRFPHQGWLAPISPPDLEIIHQVLHQTELWELRHRPLNKLSGGERQRALVARALVQQPKILLLDEPSANLDIHQQLKLLEFVQTLAAEQGLAVVLAIHDLAMAARYCQRLVVLHGSRVYADGPIETVLNPDLLWEVFGVQAQLYRDPFNQQWALSVA